MSLPKESLTQEDSDVEAHFKLQYIHVFWGQPLQSFNWESYVAPIFIAKDTEPITFEWTGWD